MTLKRFRPNLSRRRFVAASLASPFVLGLSVNALAQTERPDTVGVGPAVFLKERLGLRLVPSTAEPGTFEKEGIKGLATHGFNARPGRWAVMRDVNASAPVGWLVSAQFGDADVASASPVENYEDYDLKDSTAASFVSEETENDHAVVLRHRQWDALHMFAPLAPAEELGDMLLPVRGKASVFAYSSKQLFELGVAEYFSKLGEVNVRGVRYFRRLRLRNRKGQILYDKQNA